MKPFKDPHWYSTKLWLAVFAMLLILLAYVLTGCRPELYGDYCMAIVSAAFGFKAANVFEKKNALSAPAKAPVPKADDPDAK